MTAIGIVTLIASPFCLWWLWRKDVIRPGSFSRRQTRDIPAQAWPLMICGGLLVLFSTLLGSQIARSAAGVGTSDTSLRAAAIVSFGTYAASIACSVLAVLFARRAGVTSGLTLRASDIAVGVGALFVSYPLVAASAQAGTRLHTLITGAEPDVIAHGTLREIAQNPGDPWSWAVASCAIVGAPIVEEIIYRVMIQGAILGATRRVWTSILVTSAIFGAIHIKIAAWHAIVPLAVLGLAMGVAYERTKRLGVPIVMHMGFNALNVVLAYAMPRQ